MSPQVPSIARASGLISDRRCRVRFGLLALAMTVTLHAGLLIGLWLAGVMRTDTYQTALAAGSTRSPAVGPREADQPEELRRRIDAQAARIAGLTPEQRLSELSRRSGDLAAIDPAGVAAAAGVVESALGVASPRRAMSPAVAPPAGEFDADSASLYDIRRRLDAEGRSIYQYVFVDASGRTLTDTRPEGDLTDEDRRTARVFELARENPNLRVLVEVVRRVAEARLESAAPATDPSKPAPADATSDSP